MSEAVEHKRRARRVASDEAHAWARSLPLHNPYAKSVLRALALYVDGEGCSFVSLEQLAEDTDISLDTVRRRVVWLDQVGAIVRMAQWIDENGRRNGDGRGRRTTDKIRLLLDADPDVVEAATGPNGDDPINPSSQPGLNDAHPTPATSSDPAPALGQPSHSCQGLISEPEPEPEGSPPTPPSGGSHGDWQSREEETRWDAFDQSWQEPMQRITLTKQIFRTLPVPVQERAAVASSGYWAWHKAKGKKAPAPTSAQTFLREWAGWSQWEAHAPPPPPPPPRFVVEGSVEFRAMQVLDVVRGGKPRAAMALSQGQGVMAPPLPRGADFLALAEFDPTSTAGWKELDRAVHKRQVAAWSQRLKEWYGADAELFRRSIPTGQMMRAFDKEYERFRIVSLVPSEWPPSKDGKLYTTGPPDTLMTDTDVEDLSMLGKTG